MPTTLLAIVDTETTGLEPTDQVCELAIARVGVRPAKGEGSEHWLEGAWGTLLRPTCEMRIGARSTHHITDDELAAAPTMVEMLLTRGLPEFGHPMLPQMYDGSPPVPDPFRIRPPSDVILVAHNAEFDRRMLVQSGVHPDLLPARTICTWKCALHLYPDAEAHKNNYLRYYLGLDPAFHSREPPHRAMEDVAVTTAIVGRMLQTHTPDALVDLTKKQVLLHRVTFGKYRGQLWRDMDAGFLSWILGRDFDSDVKHTASHWLRIKSSPVRRVT